MMHDDRGRLEDAPPPGTAISDIGGERDLADRLRAAMLRKLEANRGKRHWRDPAVTDEYLIKRLVEETHEFFLSLDGDGDPWAEAADVANFMAMLADRAESRR